MALSFRKTGLYHREQVKKAGLKSATFGHIGESHVHLNILPQTGVEAGKGRALYPLLIERAMALGGTFSAEHGVGKLKRPYLVKLYGNEAVGQMKALKQSFDPNCILGRGNLFEIQ